MLNELHDLAQSLKAVQVVMASWHQHFKTCPKGTATYYVLLDSAGKAADLELIADRKRIATMRKWEVAAGVSFPAFNVLPLFEPRTEADKKAAVELRKAIISKSPPSGDVVRRRLDSLLAACNSLWVEKEPARIEKCLTTLPKDIANLLGNPPDDFRSIAELIGRACKLTADSLHQQLASILAEKIVQTPTGAADWFDALFFYSGKTAKKISLIAELADRSAFAHPANHESVQEWMNSRFQQVDQLAAPNLGQSEAGHTDAFSKPAVRLDDSFPAVRLPVLGNVILRSMSSESPCQRRYGYADSESFSVGQVSRQDMKNALEWIGDADRCEKTWCDVSSLSGASGVLFAYPSEKPESAPEIAALIAGFEDDVDLDGAKFEACAARVTTSLTELVRRQPHEVPATEVRVFVLTKPDGFRTKVMHSGRYSVERLLSSAENWNSECRNLPTMKIRQFGAVNGVKPVWSDPFVPYPAEVVSCLNTAWERAGTHTEQVPGFGIGDGLGLLLERGPVLHAIATRAIRTLVANSLSLVEALGWSHAQGMVHDAKSARKMIQKQAPLLPSIFGLLLAKLGRLKGEYMKGPPFLVGRLLSLADQLHVQYCHGVRKGKDGKAQVPPQLAGNALVSTALDSPQRAFVLVMQRIKPYYAWAQTVQGGDEVRLAKWLLGEFSRVSDRITAAIDEGHLPTSCSETAKAELLLGYLARSEKGEHGEPSTVDTNHSEASTAPA
jgi:hypothetical protein